MLKTIVLVAHLFDSSPAFEAIAAVPSDEIVPVVQVDDLMGNSHVLSDGRRTHLIASSGQRRDFGADGSITVTEADGRVWKL